MIWGAFLLFCFSAFKYQIVPTATVCVHLEYNSAKSHGVYNIGILHGLKNTTSHAKPPHKQQQNNSQRTLGAFTTVHK